MAEAMPHGDQPNATPPSPFSIGIFRAVWITTLLSNFGGLIQAVGASWMMMSLGAPPKMVAMVQTSMTLPVMLLALMAGAIADNFNRRKVILTAQSFMFVVSTTLALFGWFGLLSPWLLLTFTFLIGCGSALNSPAWQASVGDMVPRSILPSAIAFNSMGFNTARSVGPAIGGLIVAAAGPVAAFLCNAVAVTGLIGVMLRWRPNIAPSPLPPERLGTAMLAGVRYVAMSPSIRVILLRAALFGFGATASQALLPLVARDLVAGGPLTFGLLLGSFGGGAILGAYFSRALRQRLRTEAVARVGTLLIATGIALTGSSRFLILSMPCMALVGAGWVLTLSTFNISVQMASPRWVVARALSLYQMANFGGMAIGSWLLGLCANHFGVSIALYLAAAGLLASLLVSLRWPLAQVNAASLDPMKGWETPELAVDIQPRSGPISVTIEHRIAEENILKFLAVMNERRRVRLRDGARHWTLLRDLGDRELWIERYSVPTWLDYVRHNQRRTVADAPITDGLHALQIGGKEAAVHRAIERQVSVLPSASLESHIWVDATTNTTI
ncbi:MFS transporter [Sphingobium sp.]|uniref:MFS transporter n=1 Tax=Sphingobium sp. TaxID=1912891 RepID=UPI002630BA3F|nr:MFS transporter [Sphingobium sp.]